MVLETEGWKFLERYICMVMLGRCPDSLPVQFRGDHRYMGHLEVDDVDEFTGEIRSRGVNPDVQPETKPR